MIERELAEIQGSLDFENRPERLGAKLSIRRKLPELAEKRRRRKPEYGQSASNVTSLRGSRPDPALDLYRAACAAEDREDNLRAGPSLPAIGSG
jgi:hypothetical protein